MYRTLKSLHAYVNREDIVLEEDQITLLNGSSGSDTWTWWTARLIGSLNTGESIITKNVTGDTPDEALAKLEAHIEGLGLEIL